MEYVDYIEDWHTTTVHGEKMKCTCNDIMQCLYLPATALVSYACNDPHCAHPSIYDE